MTDCRAPLHNTVFAYRRRGCRCPTAVDTVRAYWRSRRRHRPGGPKDRSPHIDEIAVERAMAGDAVRLTIRERGEAVRRLTAAGLTARQVASRLHITTRTVVRYRNGHIQHSEVAA